MGKGNCHIEWA